VLEGFIFKLPKIGLLLALGKVFSLFIFFLFYRIILSALRKVSSTFGFIYQLFPILRPRKRPISKEIMTTIVSRPVLIDL
jgi:hypothetical protein